MSEKRAASQAWQSVGWVEGPAGGKNKAVKRQKLGPFKAATKEAAEQLRNQAVHRFLHQSVKAKTVGVGAPRGKPTDGLKAVLVARLMEALIGEECMASLL